MRLLLLLLILTTTTFSFAQITTLLSPTNDGGFETGTTFVANGWTTVTTGTRTWQVGTAGTQYAGSRGAYVGTTTTANGINASAVHHFYRDIAIPVGATNIILSFYYKQTTIDNGWDYIYVNTTGTTNTPVSGTIPTTGYTNYFTNTATTYSTYTLMSYTLPNTLAGTTVRLVFTWKSDGITPHAWPAIDNINLQYGVASTPPSCVSLISPLNGATGISTTSQTLSWNTDPFATGYDVYFGTSPTPPLVSTNQVGSNYSTGALISGTTYYWKIVPRNSVGSATGCSTWSFTTVSPPINDACSGATILACGTSSLSGTTVNTISETAPLGYSSPYGVWYKFTGDGQNTTISTTAGTGFDHELLIMSGTTCGSTYTLISDQDVGFSGGTETYTFTTVNGTQYYIYIAYYSTIGTSTNTGTFTISRTCTTPPVPPTNDDPCNAISLTPSLICSYITGTNVNATSTSGVTAPGCANYLGGDVWYKVVVGSSGTLTFDTQTGVITDAGMALYSGTCSSLTLISCDDDSSPNGLMPMLTVSGRTPGETIWIRLWEYGGDLSGTFGICVTEPLALPIELLSFEASVINRKDVLLEWSTASEQNNDYFIIERSIDGYNWIKIKNIDASGNSNIKINYTTIDEFAPKTIVYYRLTQVDFDGVYETFNMSIAYVNLTSNQINCDYKYYDLNGRLIDINLVNPGVYLKTCGDETIRIWKY